MANPSRRALLGAAVGLPFAGSVSVPDTPPPGFTRCPSPSKLGEDWVRALAAFEAAAGEVRAYEAMSSGRPFAAQEALQAGYDARGEAMEAALQRLLFVPAPDVAALAVKIGLAFAHEIEPRSGGEPWAAAILADALRLGSGQAGRLADSGAVG